MTQYFRNLKLTLKPKRNHKYTFLRVSFIAIKPGDTLLIQQFFTVYAAIYLALKWNYH